MRGPCRLKHYFITAVIVSMIGGYFIFLNGGTAPNLYCETWKAKSEHHKTTLITKSTCRQEYFLLVLVSSAPQNFERRNSIRNTWGSDISSSTGPRWRTFFLLGQTRNQEVSSLIEEEDKTSGDVIRGDYFEHYWNQSLKIEMGFEWAVRYCNFSFLLKADDDVFVQTPDLVTFLNQPSTPKKRLYLGKVEYSPPVRRYGKHNISFGEFSGSHYPDYCTGAGFVLSYDVVNCLVGLFDVVNPFRVDDAYVGMLAFKANITPVFHKRFVIPYSNYDDCYFVPKTLVQHRVTGECLSKLHRMHAKVLSTTQLGSFY